MADAVTSRVVVQTFNYDAEKFEDKGYVVEMNNLSTVLDALINIKESQDPLVSFRYSCRMGICGSCAMVINGKPVLACETNLSKQGKEVRVEPMKGHPILKGLVTDFDDFFAKHKSIDPWIMRSNPAEKFQTEKEYNQTEAQRDHFLPFSECIKCGLCVDACPVSNSNKSFIGPQALSQAYRYFADSKDQVKGKRLDYLDNLEGTWGCEFSGSCSKVCPKSVDPALAIQMLKAETTKHKLLGAYKEK